jgi:hypothetical protein
VRKQQGVLPLKFFGFAHSRIIPSPSSFVTLNFVRALTVIDSTFSNNSAAIGVGGGLLNFAKATVTNSFFIGNTADAGGGISNNGSGTVTVTDSTFAYNSSTEGGGIVSYRA